MSDQHGAAPDPVDKAYVQAEAVLDDDAARAARRAGVLEAVAQAAGPAADAVSRRPSPWRRGGWLAVASVAVFCGVLAARIYQPIHPRPPGAELTPASPPPVARPIGAAPAPAAASASSRSGPKPHESPPPPPPPAPHVTESSAASTATARPVQAAPTPAAALAAPPIAASPPPMAAPAPALTPAPAPPPPSPAPLTAPLRAQISPRSLDQASPSSSVGEVVVTGARISRRAQAEWASRTAGLRDAAAAGKTEEVQTLLDHGVPVDAPDSQGVTALMRSIQADHAETAALLVRSGADPDRQNGAGVSARDMAAKMNDPKLNQALDLEP